MSVGHAQCFAACVTHELGRVFELVDAASSEDDVRAGLCCGFRKRHPEARRRTGHDDHSIGQRELVENRHAR